jgi:Mut7-C ubiquitin/Mut7-C RNAse domain
MPHTAYFRFYEELNDFIPREKRKTRFAYEFHENPSVKDAIEAIGLSLSEKRCILTGDRGILKRKVVTRGYCLRSTMPTEQMKEVITRFDLHGAGNAFFSVYRMQRNDFEGRKAVGASGACGKDERML